MQAFQVGSATERRRRRPNKGRKCPTVEQIKAKMGEGMEGDVFVFVFVFVSRPKWEMLPNIFAFVLVLV